MKLIEAIRNLDEARRHYDEGLDYLSEIKGQYDSEVALYGDAGPGQGLDVSRVREAVARDMDRYLDAQKVLADNFPLQGPPAPVWAPTDEEPF